MRTLRRGLAALMSGVATFTADAGADDDFPIRVDSGRLLATGGITSLEGAAGGGIVPWAVIAGYGTEDAVGGTAYFTRVGLPNFDFSAYGAALGIHDRLELSFAQHRFYVGPLDTTLRQNVFGLKVRAFGDVVYTAYPQMSVGMQVKDQMDFQIPEAIGARSSTGVDFYLSGTKVFLAGVLGRNVLLNATVRGTRANELGLLGFGGDENAGYSAVFEGSAAILVNRHLAIGYEYRQKPDNLGFAGESDWQDVFVAWFPNKHVAVTAAYADLGSIAGFGQQTGYFLQLQLGF